MSKTQVWKNLGPSAALSCGCLDLVPAGAGMGWGWGFWPSEAHLEVSRGSEGRRWSLLKNAASWPAEAPGGALCPLQAGAPGAAFLCLWADGDLSTCEAFCTQRLLQGVSSSCPPLKRQCRERLVVLERKVCFVLGAGVAEGGQTPVQRPIPPPIDNQGARTFTGGVRGAQVEGGALHRAAQSAPTVILAVSHTGL